MRSTALAALVLVAGATLSGCGGSAVAQSDVEDQISSEYEKAVGPTDDVSCPEDLPAEVDAEMTCTVSAEDGEHTVKVTVTSVEGDTANFDIEQLD